MRSQNLNEHANTELLSKSLSLSPILIFCANMDPLDFFEFCAISVKCQKHDYSANWFAAAKHSQRRCFLVVLQAVAFLLTNSRIDWKYPRFESLSLPIILHVARTEKRNGHKTQSDWTRNILISIYSNSFLRSFLPPRNNTILLRCTWQESDRCAN